MEKFERGDTIRVLATFKDLEGNLVDPTTPKYSVYYPDGNIYLSDQDLTRISIGEYYADIPTSLDADIGYWEIEVYGYYSANRILNRDRVMMVEVRD